MKNFTLPFIISCFVFVMMGYIKGYSQVNMDSLIAQIETMPDDTNKVKYLLKISKMSFQQKEYNTLYFAQKAEILAAKLDDTLNLTKSLSLQTSVYGKRGLTDSALIKINKAINLLEANNKYQKLLAKCYYNAGNVYDEMNDYHEAAKYFLLALQYFETSGNKNAQAIIKSSLGRLYINLDENEKAIEYIEKAKLLANDKSGNYAVMISNLAIAYKNIGNYKKALKYYNESLVIKIGLKDSASIANTFNGIGLVYKNMEDYDKALENFHKALTIKEKLGNPKYIASTLNNIAVVKMTQADYPAAIELSERAYRLASSANAKHEIFFALENLYKAFEQLGQFDSALSYYKIYNSAKDSINFQKDRSKNLILKYEIKAKENELKLQTQQRNWIISFVVAMLIVLVVIYYYYKKAKAAKNKIEILQREIHHRVKNNLAINRRMVEVAKEKTNDSESQEILIQLNNRIASMAHIHEQLYQKQDITNVDFRKYMDDLSENIAISLKEEGLKIHKDIEECINVSFNKTVPIGLIINELLTNACKYAGGDDVEAEVFVEIKKVEDKLMIKISDNGKGFPIDIDIDRIASYGLKLVNGLVQQLNGTISLFNSDGANVEITIPV